MTWILLAIGIFSVACSSLSFHPVELQFPRKAFLGPLCSFSILLIIRNLNLCILQMCHITCYPFTSSSQAPVNPQLPTAFSLEECATYSPNLLQPDCTSFNINTAHKSDWIKSNILQGTYLFAYNFNNSKNAPTKIP